MLNVFDRELEQLEGFETNYVKILYYDLPKNFSSVYRTYNYTRFCTILNGEKHVTLDSNNKFTYGESDYLLLPANTTVQMEMDINTKALVLELNDELVEDVFSKVELEEDIITDIKKNSDYFLGQNKTDISTDIFNILEMSDIKKKNREFLIDLYAQKLVFNLIQDKATHHILKTNYENPINIAIKYINENIHSPITIGEIAKMLYMSESNFCHLFKKMLGITPGEYIKNRKLELSTRYLQSESVTEVAYSLGYMNISYFIKIFKEKYNLTPKQYKIKIGARHLGY